MLKIRLTRTGKKKQPNYRVVVADKDAKRDGRIVERIGHYNPLVHPAEYVIQEDRALYWLSVGAQPSDAVRRLLEKQGTMGRLQRLHAGESLASLVAEYAGEPITAAVTPTPAIVEAVAVEPMAVEETVVEEAVVEEAVVEPMAVTEEEEAAADMAEDEPVDDAVESEAERDAAVAESE
jgi:small subunit ribosomal protein S16